MVNKQEDATWLARTATVGHLLIAVVAIVGSLTAFMLAQESRLTRLEVRQNIVFERLQAVEEREGRVSKERMSELDRINDKLTQLLILNAQQHPPQLRVTSGEPHR